MAILDICTKKVETITKDKNLKEAASIMKRKNVGSLVILEKKGKNPIGMISDRDIALQLAKTGADPRTVKVEKVMSRELFTAGIKDGVLQVMRTMRRQHVNRVPVVDDGGRLMGVVSSDDILRLISTELADMAALRKRRMPNGKKRAHKPTWMELAATALQ